MWNLVVLLKAIQYCQLSLVISNIVSCQHWIGYIGWSWQHCKDDRTWLWASLHTHSHISTQVQNTIHFSSKNINRVEHYNNTLSRRSVKNFIKHSKSVRMNNRKGWLEIWRDDCRICNQIDFTSIDLFGCICASVASPDEPVWKIPCP